MKSQLFLEYVPTYQDIMEWAARIRAFAVDFCNVGEAIVVNNEQGQSEQIEWRHRLIR